MPDLPSPVTGTSIVGIASSIPSAGPLVIATHMILRALVEKNGFRAVTIEGTESPFGTVAKLDPSVRTGTGKLLASQSFLHHQEALEIIHWLPTLWKEESKPESCYGSLPRQ